MTSPLEHFDLVNDQITEALKAFNDPNVDGPRNLTDGQQAIANRLRMMVSSELHVAQVLLHDYAEAIGLFEDRDVVPNSGD